MMDHYADTSLTTGPWSKLCWT